MTIRTLSSLALASLVLVLVTSGARAMVFDPTDPLRGDRMLRASSEVIIMQPRGATVDYELFDAAGDALVGGLSPSLNAAAPNFAGSYADFAGASADVDGDGREELILSYEDASGAVVTRVDDLRGSLTPGIPTQVATTGATGGRQIRLVAGQMDEDAAVEVVVGHRTPSGTHLEFYELDPTSFEPALSGVLDVPHPTLCGGASRSFDLALADVDADGARELVFAHVADTCGSGTSRLEVGVRKDGAWLTTSSGGDFERIPSITSSYRWNNLALAVGDFDGNTQIDQIAVVGGARGLFGGLGVKYTGLALVRYEGGSLSQFQPGLSTQYITSFVNLDSGNYQDRRLEAAAADFDLDGVSELVLANGRTLEILEEVAIHGEFIGVGRIDFRDIDASAGVSSSQSGQGRLLIADLDAHVSDTLSEEIAVFNAQTDRIEAFRLGREPSSGAWNLESITVSQLPSGQSSNSPVSLVAIDHDGDGIRLGPPSASLRQQVIQPVVILNAPPIHFDSLGGLNYDVSRCWDADQCDHVSTYSTAQSRIFNVRTDVRANWAVSTAMRAGVTGVSDFFSGFVQRSIERQEGTGFRRAEDYSWFSESVVEVDALRDDQIYGTVSDYWIVEYPVYGAGQPATDVIAVIPVATQETFLAGRDVEDLSLLQDHEPGNVLSYKNVDDPLDNPMVETHLDYGDSGPAFTLTDTSNSSWSLLFGLASQNELTRESRQAFDLETEAGITAGAFGLTGSFGVMTNGSYAGEETSTHTIRTETISTLDVQFSDVDGAMTVCEDWNGTSCNVAPIWGGLSWANYRVRPYAFWSYAGALVVDYAVELPVGTSTVPTLWSALYGQDPDLAFSMPWRLDAAKAGIMASGLFAERTRDIVLSPVQPEPGELVRLRARIQNYSLVDSLGGILVFYLGDPRQGGEAIDFATFGAIAARDDLIVEGVQGWLPPETLTPDMLIYAEIVPNDPQQIRSENDVAWNYANVFGPDPLPECSNGIDDDGDGLVDYPEDVDCESSEGLFELPEPGMAAALAAGVLLLRGLGRRSDSRRRRKAAGSSSK